MVLPDTSAWIPYFRDGESVEADRLASLIDAGEVATCGPVVAELLAGSDQRQELLLLETLIDLPWARLDVLGWQDVGRVARELRQRGQKLPLTDLAIAVAAARADHALWSFDSDFERIRTVLPELDLYDPS
ncbi:MAG TPA: PIN domain-containing protein [Solirubrobacterales bacterium]|nr:PIN domain-containing protein [Solirubrobacterales bacterium]